MQDDRAGQGFPQGLEAGWRRCQAVGRSVLLAVSGGADSTALLVAGAEQADALGMRLEVASVDHGLRPESGEEAEAVRALATSLGVPCTVREVALTHGPGLEARARALRYRALEAIRAERGLSLIATAHTADDQAETLLMRLLRGTALRGAAGVKEVRREVVRPMLRLRRAQARAFLQARGVGWREDPMNADPAFLRVRVRRELLPALGALAGADPTARLAAFAAEAAEDEAFLSGLADAALARLAGEDGWDAVAVRALAGPLRRRLLVRLLEDRGVLASQARLAEAERVVREGGRSELVRGKVLDARGGWVRWEEGGSARPAELRLALGARGVFGAFELGVSDQVPLGARWQAAVPPGALPLTVRGRRPGDRVRSGGHARKLQDVLVDAKVPRERRDGLPVACDRTGAAFWVAGVPLRPDPPSAGSVWIWARIAGEASEEAGPSL